MNNVRPMNQNSVDEWTIMPMVSGNWKMNGLKENLSEVTKLVELMSQNPVEACDVVICPPFTLISDVVRGTGEARVLVGAQNCHPGTFGAHTGDISAPMLSDAGASHVIVGHSERRMDHGETSEQVCEKVESIVKSGMVAIVCVGETREERDNGRALEVVLGQLAESLPSSAMPFTVIVAYEPVWAIGTGVIPTVEEVTEMHEVIRRALVTRFADIGNGFRILYGGSVKSSNVDELMSIPNVNGALVGGASLKADDFYGIIKYYREK